MHVDSIRFTTRTQLQQWVQDNLGIKVPADPVCPAHHAPLDYLWRSYNEPSKDLVVWAPRGGGKTRLGAVATLLDLLHKPGCAVRILGGSLEQSLRMWEHLHPDLLRFAEKMLDGRERAKRVSLTNASSVAILTQSQRAVRGLRVQKLRCDEVDMFDREVWEAAQLSTKSIPGASGVIEALSTLHRPGGLMQKVVEKAEIRGNLVRWCLMEVLQRCEPERSCDGCPLWEECQGVAKMRCDGFVSIDDAIAMKRRVSQETWETEMLCHRPSTRDRVFPAFDPAIHVCDSPPPRRQEAEVWLALDFGFQAPFVCLWVVFHRDGTACVVDEYVKDQRQVHQHITEMKRRDWGDAWRVACDPAGSTRNEQTALSNVQLLRDAGYVVRTRGSHIAEGIEMIRTALRPAAGPAKLFIHPRCELLINALRSYSYHPGAGEVPNKDGTHDHLIDAT